MAGRSARRLLAGAASFAFTLAVGAMPAAAQQGTGACANLAGAERVACLRQLLTEAQAELDRAEQALGTPVVSPAAPGPAPRAQAMPATTAQHLGKEQVDRRAGIASTPEEQRFTALIISSEQARPRRLQVTLENGQVWRQVESDTQIVDLADDKRIPAEIWRSGFGGYRMRMASIGRVLKVERMR